MTRKMQRRIVFSRVQNAQNSPKRKESKETGREIDLKFRN